MVEQPQARVFFPVDSGRRRSTEAERYFRLIFEKHFSQWGYGEVNPVRCEVTDPTKMSHEVKEKALSLGASLVGITTVTQDHVYQGHEVPEKYLISLAMEMDHDRIATAPSAKSGAEAARVYYELGEVTIRMADYIRSLGYPAYAHHPLGGGRLVQVPYAIAAGLGEQGRNGIIITPQFGSRVRLGSVSTNLPLVIDEPHHWGIGAICEKCQVCFKACPTEAIPTQRGMDRGISHFTIDWQKCFPYFTEYHGCAICIKVCPFSQNPGKRFQDKLAQIKNNLPAE